MQQHTNESKFNQSRSTTRSNENLLIDPIANYVRVEIHETEDVKDVVHFHRQNSDSNADWCDKEDDSQDYNQASLCMQ